MENSMDILNKRRIILEKHYPVWNKMTIFDMFQKSVSSHPDHIILIEDGKNYSYGEIAKMVELLSSSLSDQGIGESDVLAVMMDNSLEYILISFAAAKLGAAKVSINTNAVAKERDHIIARTQAGFYIYSDKKYTYENEGSSSLSKILFIKGADIVETRICGHKQESRTNNLNDTNQKSINQNNINPKSTFHKADRTAEYLFTSGSTGVPKCIALTHDMLLRAAYANCLNRGFYEGQRVYVPLPLFHVYGYVEGLLAILFMGGTLIITKSRFSGEKAIRIIEQFQVNDILSIPLQMVRILECPALEQCDTSSLHMVYCSASTCPEWVWRGIRDKLNVKEITTGYGMTETSGASVQSDPIDRIENLYQYVGKILHGGCAGVQENGGKVAEYKVVAPGTWDELKPGESGELICRGPIVISEYFHGDEETKALFHQGWMRTGDIGYFTEEGHLKFVGKCNNIYKTNGENVSAKYIDEVISRCPGVSQVETVGIPDEKCGWVGASFIDANDPDQVLQQQIRLYCAQNLASFEIPKYYFFTSAECWPKTSTGKVRKFLLQKEAVQLANG